MAPKKPTIGMSDRMAPPIASTLHQQKGTHHPITASTARTNIKAAPPASQTPEIGYTPARKARLRYFAPKGEWPKARTLCRKS